MMNIPKPKISINIAIPASLGLQVKNKMIRTYIIGMIGRFAAIFRVDNIIIYRDNDDAGLVRNQSYIEDILKYMATPQYLRKIMMPKRRIFRYIGVLPPLQSPNHPKFKPISKIKNGEYREGVITGCKENKYEVYIGLDKPIFLHVTERKHKVGEKLIFKVRSTKRRDIKVQVVNKDDISYYWCYSVERFDGSLKKLITKKRPYYGLIIGTSRWGKSITMVENNLRNDLKIKKSLLMIFGGFNAGIYDILNVKKGSEIKDFDYVINFFPNQGTKTIRTEEAISGSLSIINKLIS